MQQQLLWETADNEISVQKCDVYLATALKKVNNRSIFYIPCCCCYTYVVGSFWIKCLRVSLCHKRFPEIYSLISEACCSSFLSNYIQQKKFKPASLHSFFRDNYY